MQVVPNIPHPESTGSERKVLKLLRSVDWGGRSGRALNSLNMPERAARERWREIDFLIVGTPGVIAIEVKGGTVSCSSGHWLYQDGLGRVVRRSKSPLVQAKDAYFALEKDYIVPRFGRSYARSVPFGFCTILAGMRRDDLAGLLGTPELPRELTGTAEDVANPAALGSFLKRVAAYWRDRTGAAASISERDVATIISMLRPEFEQVKPLALTREVVAAELVELTEEQYEVLDQWEGAQRVLCAAPAGCGKTLLATELLRREVQEGVDCLFVSGTRQLAMAVREAGIMDRVWSIDEIEALPAARRPSAQTIIIDEGQQLLSPERLSVLDGMLASGIRRGRWIWFGDPNYQLPIPRDTAAGVLAVFEAAATVQPKLRRNCRNTPEIISMAEHASGIQIGHAKVKGRGWHPKVTSAAEARGIATRVAEQAVEWLREDIPCTEVCIIAEGADVEALAASAARIGGFRVQSWTPRPEDHGAIRYASVEEFRGLESPFLIFCIPPLRHDDEAFARMLYLAITRANFALTIVATAREATRVGEMVEASVLKSVGGNLG